MKITGISTVALALLLTAGLAAMTLSGAFAGSMDDKVALTNNASGKVEGCIGCHRTRADNDRVQVQDL